MKKIVILLVSVLCASLAFAQKAPSNINVTDLNYFKYKHRLMPKEARDPLFFNYGVKVEMSPTNKSIYDEETVKHKLNVYGQNKIENFTDEDYVLSLKLNDLIIQKSQAVAGSSEGSYYMAITYKYSSHVKFAKGREVLFESDIYSPEDSDTWNSETFKTLTEANNYWKNNSDVIKSQILQLVIDESIASANRVLSVRYGFWIYEDMRQIKSMLTKKHPEYAALTGKADALEAKLRTLDGTAPLTTEDVADEIAYFKSLPGRFTTDSKADAKLRFIGYYNLCLTYILLDMPELAIPYAEMIVTNDQFPKNGEKFKEEANDLIELFSNSFFKNRQFTTEKHHSEWKQLEL
jgi:hypothetical protein